MCFCINALCEDLLIVFTLNYCRVCATGYYKFLVAPEIDGLGGLSCTMLKNSSLSWLDSMGELLMIVIISYVFGRRLFFLTELKLHT